MNTPLKDPCVICRKLFSQKQLTALDSVRTTVFEKIKAEHPELEPKGFICRDDLNRYRVDYVQGVLERDKGELSELETQVIKSIQEHEILAKDLSFESTDYITFGEKVSDKMASFGGSWYFISLFAFTLLAWIAVNGLALGGVKFDPFPFILLNLLLSCLAAIQAPVIMMSQNRQEAKDRLRSQHDYQINLKAELEIRHLHEKMDHLLMQQWHRLLEIQQIQLDLLQEISEHTKSRR